MIPNYVFTKKNMVGGTCYGSSGMVFRVAMVENAVHFRLRKSMKPVIGGKTSTRYRLKLIPSSKCVSRRGDDAYMF